MVTRRPGGVKVRSGGVKGASMSNLPILSAPSPFKNWLINIIQAERDGNTGLPFSLRYFLSLCKRQSHEGSHLVAIGE